MEVGKGVVEETGSEREDVDRVPCVDEQLVPALGRNHRSRWIDRDELGLTRTLNLLVRERIWPEECFLEPQRGGEPLPVGGVRGPAIEDPALDGLRIHLDPVTQLVDRETSAGDRASESVVRHVSPSRTARDVSGPFDHRKTSSSVLPCGDCRPVDNPKHG